MYVFKVTNLILTITDTAVTDPLSNAAAEASASSCPIVMTTEIDLNASLAVLDGINSSTFLSDFFLSKCSDVTSNLQLARHCCLPVSASSNFTDTFTSLDSYPLPVLRLVKGNVISTMFSAT